MKSHLSFLLLFLIMLTQLMISGQVPRTISYQGYLTDETGTPVPDGAYWLIFKIYDDETGGTPLWEETLASHIPVTDGVFNVYLGRDTNPLNLPFDKQYWLGISIDGNELTPRTKLTSSAYSLNSDAVDGYNVKSYPTPNTILPLNSSGKFHSSTIPKIVNMDQSEENYILIEDDPQILTSITVNNSGEFDIMLSANIEAWVEGDGDGRYWFRIEKFIGSPMPHFIGSSIWGPPDRTNYTKSNIAFSGVDSEAGPITYYLRVGTVTPGAKKLEVDKATLNAIWFMR